MNRGAALCLVALALWLPACGPGRAAWSASWRAPYGTFDRDQRATFREARTDLDAGRIERAWVTLSALAAAEVDNLELGVWLQEVERMLVESGSDSDPELAALAAEFPPGEVLRRRYAERARQTPSVAGFVLAARVESDAIAAQTLLERALELDPNCAWAHYGRAHALLRQTYRVDRWRMAREALSRALASDPAHLRARRLDAWMLAQEGYAGAAAVALENWLDQTQGDPRVTPEERLSAQLDLALAWIQRGNPREARELLVDLEGTLHERPRRLAILTVAHHELGDAAASLDCARRAEDAEPGALLPVIQQALLYRPDSEAAQARWDRVAEVAADGGDLATMLRGLRARVELERAAQREAP